jgi:hypothetical protein
METGRDRALAAVRERLGVTEVGRGFGVSRLRSLEDLRATVPLMDRETHRREVESRLGFGVVDASDPDAAELSGARRERDAVASVWRSYLEDPPAHIAVLRGADLDPIVDRILLRDVEALGAPVTRIEPSDDDAELADRILAADPDVLVVPSVGTCGWLERQWRCPLERRLRRLRLVLAEHDLHLRARTRLPIRRAGWVHAAGRVALPSPRAPAESQTLAVGSQIFELLPHGNPEQDGRRTFAEETVLPEHALVGGRYELVITSPLGLLRLRSGEHVRVVGFDAPSAEAPFPRPRVVRLRAAPDDVKLEGCTLAGAWITASVRQAFLPENPALVAAEVQADPESFPPGLSQSTATMRLSAAFADTELGFKAHIGPEPVRGRHGRALLIRMEVQGHMDRALPGRLSARLDKNLASRSPAYAYLRERGELHAPRFMTLPSGTRRAQELRRIRRLRGRVWIPEVQVVAP